MIEDLTDSHSLDHSAKIDLPEFIECKEILNNRNEVPTPEVVKHHSHLYDIASNLEPLDDKTEILLLIGRHAIKAHHIVQQVVGPSNSTFGHRLQLEWVVFGEMCLGSRHKPVNLVSVKITLHLRGNLQFSHRVRTSLRYVR